MVAQLVRVEVIAPDAGAQRRDQGADFGRRQHFVEARLFDVEDLALEGQDRLGATVAALFRGTAGRVTLDEKQLGQRRIFFLAVGEFARQARDVERALAPRHLSSLARRFPRPRGVDDFRDDRLGLLRVLEEELFEPRRHRLLDDGLDFR